MSVPPFVLTPGDVNTPDVLSFWEFFQAFVEHNAVSLTLRPCHEEICDMYEAAITGDLPGYEYFVVNMPRRTGKTMILQALPLWMFGEFDGAQMMYGSYSEKLVLKTLSYVRNTLNRVWYRDVYEARLHTQRSDLMTTVAGGMLYGAGTHATVAGIGAGLKEPCGGYIALDDPASPEEALSKVESATVIDNFENSWKGCRNSDRFCPIFVNAQRLGPDDMPGYLQRTYPNKTLTLKFPCTVGGISVFPDTWSTDTLDDLDKTRMGRYVRASQFDQDPVALGGNLIPVEAFGRWDPREAENMKWERLVIPVDTALKAKESSDYSALALWGRLDRRAYLIDAVRGKWESPQLIESVKSFWEKWSHHAGWPRPRLIIEEKAAGSPLLQTLKTQGVPAQGIERDTDKVRRVQNVLPFIETGLAYIPSSQATPGYAPPAWLAAWEAEHAEFTPSMTHKNDDQVDVTADALENLLGKKLSSFDVLFDKPQ